MYSPSTAVRAGEDQKIGAHEARDPGNRCVLLEARLLLRRVMRILASKT
jgi:hypothetical protein